MNELATIQVDGNHILKTGVSKNFGSSFRLGSKNAVPQEDSGLFQVGGVQSSCSIATKKSEQRDSGEDVGMDEWYHALKMHLHILGYQKPVLQSQRC